MVSDVPQPLQSLKQLAIFFFDSLQNRTITDLQLCKLFIVVSEQWRGCYSKQMQFVIAVKHDMYHGKNGECNRGLEESVSAVNIIRNIVLFKTLADRILVCMRSDQDGKI